MRASGVYTNYLEAPRAKPAVPFQWQAEQLRPPSDLLLKDIAQKGYVPSWFLQNPLRGLKVELPPGTVASPSLGIRRGLSGGDPLDSGLGLYSPANDQLGVAVAGSQVALFSSTGLTLPGLTAGSVVFAGTGGLLSQDNANLFFDDATDRLDVKGLLRVGTATDAAATGDFSAGLTGGRRIFWDESTAVFEIKGSTSTQFKISGSGVSGGYYVTFSNTVTRWQLYAPDGDSNLYIRDQANGRMHVSFFAASRTEFNENQVDIDHKFRGTTDANLLYLDAGNSRVGIGVSTPSQKFHVDGATNISLFTGIVRVGTATDAAAQGDLSAGLTGAARVFYDQSIPSFALYSSAGTLADRISQVALTETVFNELGADIDHRIEGDTATNLLLCDAGLDAVQIGTTTAGVIADFRAATIVFNENGADMDLRAEGDTATNLLLCDAGLDAVQIGTTSAGVIADFRSAATVLNEDGADRDLRVEGDNKQNCLLVDASDDEVAIDGRFSLIDATATLDAASYADYPGPETVATNRSSVWRLSAAVGPPQPTITGISNGLQGRVLWIVNCGANPFDLTNQDGLSLPANRIITGTGATVTLAADDTAMLWYDSTSLRWRVLNTY